MYPVRGDEHARLENLRGHQILDTPPAAAFDRITRHASRVFNAPTVWMVLVDEHRQWLKSCVGGGLDDPRREISFCTHTILADEVMVVPDALEDPRFDRNPLVIGGPRIRFYAGAPIRSDDGFLLGTLCLIDTKPRSFSNEEAEMLSDLADVLSDALTIHLAKLAAERETLASRENEAKLESCVQERTTALSAALQQARESASRLVSAQQLAHIGSWEGSFDVAGEIDRTSMVWSDEAYRLFGAAPGACDDLWAHFFRCVHPDDVDVLSATFHEAIRTRRHYSIDHRLIRPDGTVVFLHEEADIVLDQSTGLPRRVVGIAQDVTARKLAEQSARQLAALVDSSNDAIMGVDLQGIVISWNPGAEKLYGFSASERIGRPFHELIPPERQAEEAHLKDCIQRGEPVPQFDTIRICKDGRLVDVSVTISLLKDDAGKVVGSSRIARDATERKASQEALRRSEANYRALFDHNPLPSWVFDADSLRFLAVNQAAVDHYGFSREEFLAMTLPDIRPPETRATLLAQLHQSNSPAVFSTSASHRKKDGTAIEVEIDSVQIDYAGTKARLTVINDVTETLRTQRALQQSEERFSRIVTNVPGMVFRRVLHPDGRVSFPFVSEGCEEIFGVAPQRFQADPSVAFDLLDREDGAAYWAAMASSAESLTPFAWQGRLVRPDLEQVRYIQVAARPERQANGDIVWDGVAMDVTDRHEAEENRRAKEEAERANRAKSEFLSRMSHELRTPLNAILGFGQVLQLSKLSEQDTLALGYLMQGGQHLLSLVDEVLDLSRAETGQLRLTLGDVQTDTLLHECVGLVAGLAQVRNIVCRLDAASCAATVWCDERRLRQIVLNLLSNAIKYNREGGQVSIKGERTAGGTIRLKIVDSGEGLSAEEIARVFTPFARLRHESGPIEGTGLGLTISRGLAEAMAGSIGVESEVGCGCTFWVELPLAATKPSILSPVAMVPSTKVVAEEMPSRMLLYIEDNPSNLQVVTMLLSRHRPNWRLRSARTGAEGLAAIKEEPADLVLLDLQLPGMNGAEVLAELRRDPRTSSLAVVVLSADATPQSREKLLALGANEYLAKPFDVTRLLELLDQQVRAFSSGQRPQRRRNLTANL